MDGRRVVQLAILGWAALGAAVALPALGSVEADALPVVAAASVLGPAAAVAAAWLLGRGSTRWAGASLLLSVLTPMYFAAALAIPAFAAGLVLLAAPGVLGDVGRERQG